MAEARIENEESSNLNPVPSTKPAWLARLEEESWQAELIISGVAILGALQLPGLMDRLQYYLLDTLYRGEFMLWSFIMIFASMAVNLLIFTFIAHFMVRTLWIGMIGINSVYPQGFTRNKRFSEDYQDKLVEEFGDVNGYITRLDRLGSSIFGMGFSVSLVCMGYVMVMVLIGLVAHFGHGFLPENFTLIVGGILYFLLVSMAITLMVMGSKKYQEREFVKRWHFPLNMWVSKVFFNIGYRPVMIITNLFTSKVADNSRYMLRVVGISVVVGFLAGLNMMNDNKLRDFKDSRYHRLPSDTTMVNEAAYWHNDQEAYYQQPVIDKKELHTGEVITVFIPLPNREKQLMLDSCSLASVDETDLERLEVRKREYARELDCGYEYVEIALNGRVLDDYRLRRHYNQGIRDQYGFQTVLYDFPGLKTGENLLRVTTNYLNEEGEPRDALIYFYYSGLNATRDTLEER